MFLAAKSRPVGTLQYRQLQGFLFAIASSPELILPSEWIPFVFADRDPGYRNGAEAQSIAEQLIRLYNDINSAIVNGRPVLAADCAFRDDPLANFDDDAPIRQWSEGFTAGHNWLSDTWHAYIPNDDEVFGLIVLTLSFFTSRRLANAYRRELGITDSLEELALALREAFPDAMIDYARLGRAISGAMVEELRPGPAPRRAPRRRHSTRP